MAQEIEFTYDQHGYELAVDYLKQIGKYDEFMNNRTSTDGVSLVQYANSFIEPIQKPKFTYRQANLIASALGINLYHAKVTKIEAEKQLPSKFYRNRFCSGVGLGDSPILNELCDLGYMEVYHTDGNQIYYCVTDDGMIQFRSQFMSLITPNLPDAIVVDGVTLEAGDEIKCKFPSREGKSFCPTYKVRSIERHENPEFFNVRFNHPHWAEWDIEMCPSTVYNSEGVSILPSRHFATIAEIIKPSK